ncbi:MAG: 1-(5-phosphoribosyl)-5-((5-phosphoribosylamino)methylideneamino)imidazole-4-carboxamide isomerase, partial [Clostridiales bacterium]|nr:1-(5-phosphoribosyl)-5-((5-phosphoribosylamino)methylideneamino)imidazole-4-carboxamide isomerase [Clostridiales bacterium]
ENPALLRELILRFGADKVVVGLDARDGLVAIKGWVESAPVSAAAFAVQVKEAGIKTLIYTDISRDGALSGVNVAATAALQRETGLQVIASGGVASLDDLRALARAGVHGAILGKALFEGKFTVAEAKKAVEACS